MKVWTEFNWPRLVSSGGLL